MRPGVQAGHGGDNRRTFPDRISIQNFMFEQSGKMVHWPHTVALKGVVCQGVCAANCPRAEYLYWRESWLRRVDAGAEPEHSENPH